MSKKSKKMTFAFALAFIMLVGNVFASSSVEKITLNPLDMSTLGSPYTPLKLSEDLLTVTTEYGLGSVRSTVPLLPEGKYYFEATLNSGEGSIGVASSSADTNVAPGMSSGSYGYFPKSQYKNGPNGIVNYGGEYNYGDVVGVAVDMDEGTLSYYINGVPQGTAYDSLGTLENVYVMIGSNNSLTKFSSTINLGGAPFKYSLPDGYKPVDNRATKNFDVESSNYVIKSGSSFEVYVSLNNVENIYAEDIMLKYDTTFFTFVGSELVDPVGYGIYNSPTVENGSGRFVVASRGESYGITGSSRLLKLIFKANNVEGTGEIGVSSGRMADGNGNEKDGTCGSKFFTVEKSGDVNNTGTFTLGDLAIAGRLFGGESTTWLPYTPDIDENGLVDDIDLAKIVEEILKSE